MISWKYTLNSDGKTATLTGVSSGWYDDVLSGTVILPRYVKGVKITAVADSAFAGRSIEELVIPEGITKLGERAFAGNRSLKKLTVQGVTDLGAGAFYNCDALEMVNLNDNITEIPQETFWECSSLTTLKLPSKLERIGDDAFLASGLSEIAFPDTVKEIGESAFCATALKKVILPNHLTEISTEAFNGCANLTSVYIPQGVTAIGKGAFLTMQGGALNDIYYAGSQTEWSKIKVDANGNNILKQAVVHYCAKAEDAKSAPVTAPKPVEETGWIFSGNAVVGYSDSALALSGTVEFPSYYYEYSNNDYGHVYQVPITTIGDLAYYYAFQNCTGVTAFVIPEGITTITQGAFYEMENMTSISLPSTLRSIGGSAFYGCKGIRQIQLPENLETISSYAFSGTRIKGLTIPASVKSIGSYAFSDNAYLETVSIQCNATMGESIFSNCDKLKSVQLNENMLEIPKQMFWGCGALRNIKLPKNLKKIGDSAFHSAGLEEIEIPESVTSIGEDVFGFTNLKKLVLPQNITKINVKTFYWCNKLEKVYIPAKVTYIDMDAFEGCSALTDIYYAGTEKQWANITIEEMGNKLLAKMQEMGKIHYGATPATMSLGL